MLRGPALFVMAWRNLWRNRRRTIITLSSLAFGVMTAVTFTGPITMLIFAVGVALTFPAIKAARLQPVDAMHYR